MRNKLIPVLTATALMLSLSAVPVFADSAHHTGSYPVCTADGCQIAETHQHGQDTYCGHSLDDGHDYHSACSRSDCASQDIHEHDGLCYFGHCETVSAATGCNQESQNNARPQSDRSGHHGHHGHHGGGHH